MSVLPSPSWVGAGSFRPHFCLPKLPQWLVQVQGTQLWRRDRLQPQARLSACLSIKMSSLGTAAGFEAEVISTAKAGFNGVTQPNLLCRLLILWAVNVLVQLTARQLIIFGSTRHSAVLP